MNRLDRLSWYLDWTISRQKGFPKRNERRLRQKKGARPPEKPPRFVESQYIKGLCSNVDAIPGANLKLGVNDSSAQLCALASSRISPHLRPHLSWSRVVPRDDSMN